VVTSVSRAGGIDLRSREAAVEAVRSARPDVVYHLAALTSVGRSWEAPDEVLRENVAMTLNVLEAVRTEAAETVVLVPGSGELYGFPDAVPTDEDAPLRPQNPYAVSKASADLLAGFYADAHGLRVIRARAFNHAGPGQRPIFAVSSFARQAVAGRLAGDEPVRVVTGRPDTRRDYTDVRDVARAYRLLAAHADGGVYNVCSGVSRSAAELVEAIAAQLAPARVEHVVDPALVRDHEVTEIRGSNDRLRAATGWEPEIPFEHTVADTLAWWESELGRRD
jgi:GDP-4-dehydro-6-deoxy-D-mannose reductase